MLTSRRALLLSGGGLALTTGLASARPPAAGWTSLFDGKDLTGWDTWLGIPHSSVEGLALPRDGSGRYTTPIGLNRDPRKVFTVVSLDGEPAIRISGELFGALTSQEEYGDFHLRLQYRWGEKKWPPKQAAPRDSGVLYYCAGEHGVDSPGKFWMRSLECQVQEHDTGDFWSVAGVVVDTVGDRAGDVVRYRKGGQRFTVPAPGISRRVLKSEEHEKEGGWNLVEVLCLRGTCIHAVNGVVNMVMTDPRVPEPGGSLRPLRKGRLQIQSEGAEVFYRRIGVRPIEEIPAAYRQA
jgi:hypothetical protein